MVTFPPLTPSDFRWEAPTYEQVSHTAEDGAIVRQILMDTPGQGRVDVEFQNCRDSDFEAVLAAHDATFGQWDALTLPDAFWKGRGAALKAVVNSYDTRLEWAFAEVPAADWAKKGRCTIKVTFKHRVRPLALTLDPGGTATPLVPKTDPGTPALVDALPVLNCNIVVPPIPPLVGCQAFWTSRQITPMSNSIVADSRVVIDAQGNSYMVAPFLPDGAVSVQERTLILVKRDKDGNILWQQSTPAIPSDGFFSYNIHLCGNGVYIGLLVESFGRPNRCWYVLPDGTQAFSRYTNGGNATIEGGQLVGSPMPIAQPVMTNDNSSIIVADRYFSYFTVTRLSLAGAYQGHVICEIGSPLVRPIPLANGNMVVCGISGGTGWVCEFKTTLEADFIVNAYVYPGTTGFIGMVEYVGGYCLVDTNRKLYTMDTTYTMGQAFSFPSAGQLWDSLRGIAVAVGNVIRIAFRGEHMYDIDVFNSKAYLVRQTFYREVTGSGQGTYTDLEEATASTPTERDCFDITAGMGVGSSSLGGFTAPGGESDRRVVHAFGFKTPPGVWKIETHPPYVGRFVQITVTSAPVTMTSVPSPIRTTQTIPPVRVLAPVTTPSVPPFSFASDNTITWDLQSAPICPPPLTTVLISGPATVITNTDQQFFAAVIPDPAATAWPTAYAWSSPDAVFSSTTISNPLVKWNLPIGQKRTLTLIVSNAGYTKTATLEVTIGTAVAQFNEDFL